MRATAYAADCGHADHAFPACGRQEKSSKNAYACPLYMYPVRAGGPERPSFMLSVDLPSGLQSADFWTLRGTALVLALAL